MKNLQNFAIYGGGSWGTALACCVARAMINSNIMLFIRNSSVIEEILSQRTNSKYLGHTVIPSNISPTHDISSIINKDVLIIAVPSISFIDVITELAKEHLSPNTILLIATKGLIEVNDDILLLSEAIKLLLPNRVAFISGPNFADELAQDLLTSITVASTDLDIANEIAGSIRSTNLITTTTDDITTVQIAGAIKNIIAINSGMHDAMGHKNNAKAWLMTEAMKEIMKLSIALGGRMETVLQPAVLGDLILTCYSKNSRNTRFGYEIYGQKNIESFMANYPVLVEGVKAAQLVTQFAIQHKVDLPTVFSVAKALNASL